MNWDNEERNKKLMRDLIKKPRKKIINKMDLLAILAMIFAAGIFLLRIFWAPPPASGEEVSGELNGRKIMEEAWDSYRAIPEEEEVIEIFTITSPHPEWYNPQEAKNLLKNRSLSVIHKKIIRQLRYDAGGEDRIRVIFLEPPRDKDSTFLFWRHWDMRKADDVWGWFSALRRIRRIASPDQRDHFMGTALTFEDVRRLMGENLDDFLITLVGEEKIAGVECYKIILQPKETTDTGYGRREFLRIKNGLPAFVQINYYSKAGGLIKTQKNSQIHEFRPSVWRPGLVEMKNIRNNYTSLLYFTKREVKKFDNRNFDISTLEREGK